MKHPVRLMVTLIITLLAVAGLLFYRQQQDDTTQNNTNQANQATQQNAPVKGHVKYNVPLIDQMSSPALYNGCEVTSLAMLLQYYGKDVSKNDLADAIKTVPLTYDDGDHGNPNVGFVGSVSGDTPGLGVYHGPIRKLAKQYIGNVTDISGSNFSAVIRALSSGHPVWTITTATFAKVEDFEEWSTPQGDIKVTYSQHSVVITGYSKAKRLIYINNPYGQKNEAVDWDDFAAAYKQMGQQAIYINQDK